MPLAAVWAGSFGTWAVEAAPQVGFRVTIERVRALEGFEGGGAADFYACVTIDGTKECTSAVDDDDTITPDWEFFPQVDASSGATPVTIEIWDEDGAFRLEDDHADINPGSGPDLNLIVTFAPCEVTGDVNGGCGTSLIGAGNGDEDGNAEIVFSVDVDSDGDGLLNSWESQGLDVDDDGVIDLDLPNIAGPGLGTDPNHKDLFLELDWNFGFQPNQANVQAMKAAFAFAPVDAGGVPNPDGRPGITLWVDTGTLVDPMGIEGGIDPAGSCGDGVDNDGNGVTDAGDPSCLVGDDLTRESGAPAGSCRSGADDDGDGLVDGADPDCLKGGNRLFDPTGNELGGSRDMTCSNGIDDDGDGLIDGNDGNCQYPGNVDFGGIYYILKNGTEGLPVEDGMGPNSCFDGVDNGDGDEDMDGNVEIDGGDPDCRTTCFNGTDDDGDTVADGEDLNCQVGGNFDRRARSMVFRYGISAEGGGGTGWAPGKEFVLRNRGDGGTLMHEFGHNLGLQHGGADFVNRKPNYISVMDYDEQFCLFGRGSTLNCGGPRNLLDYSPPRWGGNEGSDSSFDACFDGIDNDDDGFIDAEDAECQDGILRGGAPLADLNETQLNEADVVDPGNDGHSIVFRDQNGATRIWNANSDLDDDGMPDGIDWAGDGVPYDGSNLLVDVNGDSICVCAGPDGTLETDVLQGDDVPFPASVSGGACAGRTIRNGPNQVCETNAVGSDQQTRAERNSGAGSCTDGTDNDGDGDVDGADSDCREPNPLQGADDWTAIRMTLRGLGDAERGTAIGQIVDDREQTVEAFQEFLLELNTSDLRVNLSARPDPVELGDELSYDISVTTNGPNPTSQVRLRDFLSPNVMFVGDTGNCSQGTGGELTCDVGELLLQETRELSIAVQTGACDAGVPLAIPNSVMVENLAGPDPDEANNQAGITVTPEDNTPPEITSGNLTVAPTTLTPPNHKLVPIQISAIVADDVCDADPAIFCSVESDELPDGGQPTPGEGHTLFDIVFDDEQIFTQGTGVRRIDSVDGTGSFTLMLRAERDGSQGQRTYTIACFAEDAQRNASEPVIATVLVPGPVGGEK